MIKKVVLSLLAIVTIASIGFWFLQKESMVQQPTVSSQPTTQSQEAKIEDMVFDYKKSKLDDNCNQDSKMLCAVDFAIKCTINPEHKGCKESKLPKFIFMNDESLKRPTEISFKLHKIKPIAADLMEVHTNSSCNGNWFGLCQGRVIYVLVPENDSWRVKDIYAIEDRNV